ncbi:MAG: pyruvate carboxylase subunit B [Burkholderiales bacterium]|nr:pyruvate carboxylase subunit B [Burkholderiales bacterium]
MDTTLRDGHQSLWATRMTTAMMLPIAEKLDRAGFEVIDLMSGVQFDVAIRHLKEDPWERIRLMRARVTNTPLQANLRSKSVLSFDVLPDDINALWIERLIANGIRSVRAFDALNDMDNIVESLRLAKRLGARAIGAVVFSISPVHTDAMYVAKTRELIARAGVDAVMLKDASGLLTLERVRTLVPALKAVCGEIPLEFHSHALTGLAPLLYLEAARLGADQLHTCIAPLANGAAQPAVQTIARNLRAQGYEIGLDQRLIGEVSMHFARVAEQERKPCGTPAEYDAFHYLHQIPGGMLSNMRAQLDQAGLGHKLQDVLAECGRVRAELGWPVMVTPFSQLVGTQAVLNVVQGERYRSVPDEVKKYALGYYGKLLAPVDPDVLDRIVAVGSSKIGLTPAPREPAVAALRRRYPAAGDDERLLRYMYAGSQVDDMLAAGPTQTAYDFGQPVVGLLRELMRARSWHHVQIERGELKLHLSRHAAQQPSMEEQGGV